jgi:uncharacterized RDD family membrane protein YckC
MATGAFGDVGVAVTSSAEFAPPGFDVPRPTAQPGRWEVLVRRASQHLLDLALSVGLGFLGGLLAGVVTMPLVKWGVVPPLAILWAPAITFAAVAFGSQLLIDVLVPLRRGGVTPGMHVMGLRVEKVDGREPGVWDYVIRSLLFTVDGLLLGLVAVVSIAVTKRRQRIGDLFAQTVVVRVVRPPRGRRAWTVGESVVRGAAPEPPEVPELSDLAELSESSNGAQPSGRLRA